MKPRCKLTKPSTEPFGSLRWICPIRPERQRNLEPWWNLPTLVEPSAELFGKPLLWLKTPKLLLLGKYYEDIGKNHFFSRPWEAILSLDFAASAPPGPLRQHWPVARLAALPDNFKNRIDVQRILGMMGITLLSILHQFRGSLSHVYPTHSY